MVVLPLVWKKVGAPKIFGISPFPLCFPFPELSNNPPSGSPPPPPAAAAAGVRCFTIMTSPTSADADAQDTLPDTTQPVLEAAACRYNLQSVPFGSLPWEVQAELSNNGEDVVLQMPGLLSPAALALASVVADEYDPSTGDAGASLVHSARGAWLATEAAEEVALCERVGAAEAVVDAELRSFMEEVTGPLAPGNPCDGFPMLPQVRDWVEDEALVWHQWQEWLNSPEGQVRAVVDDLITFIEEGEEDFEEP
jgi:hypothetical protein